MESSENVEKTIYLVMRMKDGIPAVNKKGNPTYDMISGKRLEKEANNFQEICTATHTDKIFQRNERARQGSGVLLLGEIGEYNNGDE